MWRIFLPNFIPKRFENDGSLGFLKKRSPKQEEEAEEEEEEEQQQQQAVAWVVRRLPLVTRERIRGGCSTRCAIQIKAKNRYSKPLNDT